jgi:hypothetical protein
MRCFIRTLAGILAVILFVSGLRADALADDIAAIHVEAIGGQERVNRLNSFRAAGRSALGEVEMDFQMWAARPRSIRIEVMMGNQTLIQGWDGGRNEPWIRGGPDGEVQPMPAKVRERFKSESDFDTPLVNAESRGFALEYAGEDEVGGRPVVKLLATRNLTDQSTLYLAADTYFIVRQDRTRIEPNGVRVETQTFYGDFRPVLGVIMPHRISSYEGERLISEVTLSWIEPNPPMEPGLFATPTDEPTAPASVPLLEPVEDLKAPPAKEQGNRILEFAN